MFVGVCTLELYIFHAYSLKDKRQVIKSIIDRLKSRYNISVAEVGQNDVWNKSEIGISCVSNSKSQINEVFNKIVDFIDNDERVEITNMEMEIW
ncbi:hypothetical protein EAL2_c08670 [Peptoclostridium acidaminophilum DSM 3953]|uniref:DUF503 domain-containing protein n=1 Tax=Peptoclostridium acidaminophilum DSM 3953 TaxID=1286171 RepID=W8TJ09_PEPAC|nr:DUF503 domain-containing protein [Peptoclostridium acidaminophilum]AHM56167.1 hypothetical protein EAL2_c08670 [Peptoclostridium acidaminophilum DSM 3953]